MQRVFSFSLTDTLHNEMNLLRADAWELQFSSQSKIAQGDISGSALDSTRPGTWFACMYVRIWGIRAYVSGCCEFPSVFDVLFVCMAACTAHCICNHYICVCVKTAVSQEAEIADGGLLYRRNKPSLSCSVTATLNTAVACSDWQQPIGYRSWATDQRS